MTQTTKAHDVEPFTSKLWICVNCGNTFDRKPECEECRQDPFLLGHTCDIESALIEGDCEPDAILVNESWENEGGS